MEYRGGSTVALETLGCKLNQAETELLASKLTAAGYHLVAPRQGADIYVLNTCTVTHIADRKSRHLLRWARRRNPKSLVIAIGCYAQRAPQELVDLPGVNLVLGNEEKWRLVEVLQATGVPRQISHVPDREPGNHHPRVRTRTLVKIQDGCRDFCTYCIVPWVRGGESSLPADQVVAEVKAKVEAGYKEIVLTGTKIGSYRADGGGLKRLLERILAETVVERLRLSSLQPQDISPDLIHLWRDGRLCRHLHLPLQSGSQAVLTRMGRCYSKTDYRRAVSLVRECLPDIAITSDIIVGFPGESDQEFEESYRFCQEIGFAALNVFPYSPRAGTAAAGMRDQVEPRLKNRRKGQMLALAGDSAQRFRERFLGRTLTPLWEGAAEGAGIWSGLSDNGIRVFARSEEPLTNKLLPVWLIGSYKQGLWGELADATCHQEEAGRPI